MHLKKEQKTQAYKETMDIGMDNINTYEIRNKVDTIKWNPICEVIEESHFTSSEIFSDDFMQQCKDNANEAQSIPLRIKNNI